MGIKNFLVVFMLLLWTEPVDAQFFGSTGTAIALPEGDAVYHAESDTYYRLMRFQGSKPYSWEHALKMAKSYEHEGREGFLAIIPDADTHYFLTGSLVTLRQEPAWFGLRVQCTPGVISKWYTGKPLTSQTFRAWAPDAIRRIRDMCTNTKAYLPVYTQPTDLGVRWQVDRKSADRDLLLVAYPSAKAAAKIRAEIAEFKSREQEGAS